MIDNTHLILRRYALGMTQKQLAERVGIGKDQISRIESGRAMPSIKTLLTLCRELHTQPNKVLRWYD